MPTSGFDTIVDVSEAPPARGGRLLVRQALTGRELPPSAENVVRFWRDHVQEQAGADIEALRSCLLNQRDFAPSAATSSPISASSPNSTTRPTKTRTKKTPRPSTRRLKAIQS